MAKNLAPQSGYFALFMIKYMDKYKNMSSKFNCYLGILTILAVLFANTVASFAGDDMESFSFSSGFEDTGNVKNVEESVPAQERIPEMIQEETPAIVQGDASGVVQEESSENLIKQDQFLERLKQELNLSKAGYRQLLNSISDTKNILEKVTEEKMNLKRQLANIDMQIAKTSENLLDVVKNIIQKENEITLLYEQIEIREVAMEYQKELLKDYIKILYQEENTYFNIEKDGTVNAFKLLLADGSVSENLRELDYFNLLNEAGQQIIDKLEGLAKELEGQQITLEKTRVKLEEFKQELKIEKEQLELQKESKEHLLKITQGQEDIYTQLFEQTIKDQEQLINDIKNLGNAVTFIEQRIAEDGEDFDPDKYLALLDYKTQALYSFKIEHLGLDVDGFSWPADPFRGISAYFRDPSYVGAFGVQHNAVDIPAYQGSPVRVAADGVVYTAKDNGYGYSYIIVAHAGGFMTVYGHISSIIVAPGDTVTVGSILGLSGGMPGTKGAGYMTTGPHLHFEMLLNGLYVDPLDYLPLEILTEEQIGALPEKYFDEWEAAVLKAQIVPVLR